MDLAMFQTQKPSTAISTLEIPMGIRRFMERNHIWRYRWIKMEVMESKGACGWIFHPDKAPPCTNVACLVGLQTFQPARLLSSFTIIAEVFLLPDTPPSRASHCFVIITLSGLIMALVVMVGKCRFHPFRLHEISLKRTKSLSSSAPPLSLPY